MPQAKDILHPDNEWEDAYPQIAVLVRTLLDAEYGYKFTTTQVANRLWPLLEGEDKKVRDRLFRALKSVAKHELAEYTTGRRIKRVFGEKRQALVWTAPEL